jgi:hypothetical protein
MRKLALLCGIAVIACAVQAGPQYVALEARIGTNAAEVVSVTNFPIGYMDEILIQAPSRAAVTADVSVISAPNVGTGIPSTVLYTNSAMSAADVVRPRVAQDNNTGAALSSLTVAERFLCNGDPVTLRVAQTPTTVTGVVFKVWLKIDNQ